MWYGVYISDQQESVQYVGWVIFGDSSFSWLGNCQMGLLPYYENIKNPKFETY